MRRSWHNLCNKKRQWCSGNINAFQAFALDSISGWRSFLQLSKFFYFDFCALLIDIPLHYSFSDFVFQPLLFPFYLVFSHFDFCFLLLKGLFCYNTENVGFIVVIIMLVSLITGTFLKSFFQKGQFCDTQYVFLFVLCMLLQDYKSMFWS